MAASTAESAVRNYLAALKDPSSLRDQQLVSSLESKLESSEDQVERVLTRQALQDARNPSVQTAEDEFVTHAKSWADEHGVGAPALSEEGVPAGVLRRAGFAVSGGGRGRRRGSSGTSGRRNRVTVEDIRKAIPKGTFTIKTLEQRSGASTGSVRKVVNEELAAGNISAQGADKDHRGPGRAPTLYRR